MNKNSVIIAALLTAAAASSAAEDLSLCRQGYAAYEAREFARAIQLYDACVANGGLTPASLARTYRNYAIAFRTMGQPDKAIDWETRALALQPLDAWNDYVNRGNAYSDAGRFDEALADYAQAAVLQPQSAQIHYNRGLVFERQKAADKAKAEFLEAYRKGLRTPQLQERLAVHGAFNPGPSSPDASPAASTTSAQPTLVLAEELPRVWQIIVQSCSGRSATQFNTHPEAAAVQASKFVSLAPVGLRFGIPRLPDLPRPHVKVYLGDRSRGVVDHYVFLGDQDLGVPSAALVVTEVPPSMDTAQKVLATAEGMQRQQARKSGAMQQLRRIQGPYGEALEVLTQQRISSNCFPTSDYIMAPAEAGPHTVGISRFAVIKGKLAEFALVVQAAANESPDDAIARARRVMDGFWLGLQPL